MKKLTKIVTAAFFGLTLLSSGYIEAKPSIKEPKGYYQKKAEEKYAKGRILIGFDEIITKEQADEFIESHDSNDELNLTNYHIRLKFAEVKVPEGEEIKFVDYFNNLKEETIVNYAEPDYIAHINE